MSHHHIQAIEKILLHDWDPIGIAHEPRAQDEYRNYALEIATLFERGGNSRDMAELLLKIERDMMGLNGDTERADRVAQNLLSILSK